MSVYVQEGRGGICKGGLVRRGSKVKASKVKKKRRDLWQFNKSCRDDGDDEDDKDEMRLVERLNECQLMGYYIK